MVCGRWRDIVFSTPHLWSNIKIDFDAWTKDFHVLNQLSKSFLKRSRTLPLHLSLILPAEKFTDGSSRQGACPTLNSLVKQCERWEHMSLEIVPQHFPSLIFEPIRGRLPLLSVLDLENKGSGNDSGWSSPFSCFDICPALHTLQISPELYDAQEHKVPLPCTQIKTLQLILAHNVTAFPLLSHCTDVESLELREVGGLDKEGDDYSGHLTHGGVKILDIGKANTQDDIDGVLKHTTLSRLSSLRIWGRNDYLVETWLEWDSTYLQAFLHRSSCAITSLYLRALPITDIQALALLRMLPTIMLLNIEEFVLKDENFTVTTRFLDGLNASLDSPSFTPLVPQLTHLKLLVHAKDLSSDAVLAALSSRWLPDPRHATEMGVECLRSVTIVVILDPDDNQEGGHLSCLRCFRDAGMQLAITYGTPSELRPNAKDEEERDEDE
ncbi:hypothetical protein PM082_009000 [Marasmius tenuissimus]|nr:hypothetical protein PM082_009000 [Marasmius tenuissimus]